VEGAGRGWLRSEVCREIKCCTLSLGRKGCDEWRHFAFLIFEDATLRDFPRRMMNIYCFVKFAYSPAHIPPKFSR
jgi:hypothetical protein